MLPLKVELFFLFFVQAPVVLTLDSAIQWINHYPADKYYGNQLRSPLDSDLSGGSRYPTFEQPGPAVWEFPVTSALHAKLSNF